MDKYSDRFALIGYNTARHSKMDSFEMWLKLNALCLVGLHFDTVVGLRLLGVVNGA
jgi:hypothetical protein